MQDRKQDCLKNGEYKWLRLLRALSLGLLWAIMTIGVYITYRILSITDLTVEGDTLGAAIAAHAITSGMNPYLGTLIALLEVWQQGFTGLLHTKLKIPALYQEF